MKVVQKNKLLMSPSAKPTRSRCMLHWHWGWIDISRTGRGVMGQSLASTVRHTVQHSTNLVGQLQWCAFIPEQHQQQQVTDHFTENRKCPSSSQ